MPFRDMPEPAATSRLLAEIALVAQEYGARHEIIPGIAKECALLFSRKFKHLAIDEIREAYRQWASGEIIVKGGEMYGGSFNAAQLGKVLTAYQERRMLVAAKLRKALDDEREAAEEQERAEKMKREFEANFPALFEKVRQEAQSWEDVPGYFFNVLWKRVLIELTVGERDEVLARAQAEAERQIAEERRSGKMMWQSTMEDRRRVIAGKMLVWQKCIKNDEYKLEGFNNQNQ